MLGISGQDGFGVGGGARREILTTRKRAVEDDLDLLVARMLDGMRLDLELTLSRSAPDDEAAQSRSVDELSRTQVVESHIHAPRDLVG